MLSATLGLGTGSKTKRSLGNWGISSPHDYWIRPLVPSEWHISEVLRWVANEAYFSTVLQKCQWHLISSSVKQKEKSAIALEKKKILFHIYKKPKCLCFLSPKPIFLGFKVLKRILRLLLTKKLIIFLLISSYGISHLFWFTMKATGRSGMYLPREVLNFVRHVDFLKCYYFKFYTWRKKGTKASKLEMTEYS